MAKPLEVRIRRERDIGIIATGGSDYINIAGGELIAEACDELLARDVYHLLLNLKKCRLINCRSLSSLLEVVEKVKARQGQMAFCCAGPVISKVFRITRSLQSAALYNTEQEALQALSEAPRTKAGTSRRKLGRT